MMLQTASREWSSRAPDERFGSLVDMKAAALNARNMAASTRINTKDLHASVVTDFDSQDPKADAVVLNGLTGAQAYMTNWSFNQFAIKAGAPSGYLQSLSADTAARCLNEGIAKMPNAKAMLLFEKAPTNGALKLRAITSQRYSRIWNLDVIERLQELEARGPWQPAPAAFDGSRGLYMGDRDMFAFMVDSDRRIFEKLPGGGLSRGFFVRNSEVGAASFDVLTFLYQYICGNHCVWGVSEVKGLRLRHVGRNNEIAMQEWRVALREYSETSASEDEAKITRAREMVLGATKADVLDAIFALKTGATQKQIGKGLDTAIAHEDWYGNPFSVWGAVSGMTQVARDMPNADDRYALENAGRKLMEIAF